MPAQRPRHRAVGLLLASTLTLGGCSRACRAPDPPREDASSTSTWLASDLARLAGASPDLHARITGSPHALFRFVNQSWMQRVCAAFEDDLRLLPTVRLHGDAHVEQYAVTNDARGLDDFDDSATGPAVIDLVRFLGSVELTAHQRGWDDARQSAAEALFDGYAKALREPSYLPPDPAVVSRLRGERPRDVLEFLAWAESLMQERSTDDEAAFARGWERFETYAEKADRDFTAAYLRPKRAGWLTLGIGSALSRKLLIRVEGHTSAPEDDRILEAKLVKTLRGVPCLNVPTSGEVLRVVEGMSQVGRLRHRVIVVVPLFPIDEPDARGWWVRSWEPSYRELEIGDLASREDLVEVAHDVGAQLGGTNLADVADGLTRQKRLMELEAIHQLEPRIRALAHELAMAVLEAWQGLQTSGEAPAAPPG